MRTISSAFDLRQAGVLLRGEAEPISRWVQEWNAARVVLYLAIIVAGSAAYGAAMGIWRAPLQSLFTAIKFPLLILLTTFGNALLNGMLAPLREPVRNRWLYDFGLIACALIIPFAILFGAVRGIPFGWRLIDCSFGIFGIVPLLVCKRDAQELATFFSNSGEHNEKAARSEHFRGQ